MKPVIKITILILFFISMHSVRAHEIRPAYLLIKEQSPKSYTVLWKVPRTVERVLDIQPQFEEGFKLSETVPPRILEAYVLYTYKLTAEQSLSNTQISIHQLNTTGIDVLTDIRLLNGQRYSFLLQPTHNIATVPQSSSKWMVAKTYTSLGIEHILFGFDHLLFVLALIMITIGFKKLLKTITSFTLAHSITLSFSALGIANLPSPPVEAVIALSIVFLALEILKVQQGIPSLTSQKPWLVAFSFGLLHGFGFAGALKDIGLPQNEIPLALATFNIGVEVGQILFVIIMLIVLKLVKSIVPNRKQVSKLAPYSIGAVAAFWLIERVLAF
ncbi:HupE/UreJ family protein [Echinicola salinicaeni]|uniref:HupE/UreJ family protein n=1 Tax=Echinicola salinicaeni TaxID=2762757 RepID=UPI0016474930|nr:HupE/UreJ family protein [Echinicola salinicaeni]